MQWYLRGYHLCYLNFEVLTLARNMQHQVHADQGTKKKPAPMFGRMGHSCNVGIASYPVSLVLKGEDYTVMIFKHTIQIIQTPNIHLIFSLCLLLHTLHQLLLLSFPLSFSLSVSIWYQHYANTTNRIIYRKTKWNGDIPQNNYGMAWQEAS